MMLFERCLQSLIQSDEISFSRTAETTFRVKFKHPKFVPGVVVDRLIRCCKANGFHYYFFVEDGNILFEFYVNPFIS